MEDLIAEIKKERLRKKMSRADLANAVGVHKGTISMWENGIKKMSIDHLEATLKALNLKIKIVRK